MNNLNIYKNNGITIIEGDPRSGKTTELIKEYLKNQEYSALALTEEYPHIVNDFILTGDYEMNNMGDKEVASLTKENYKDFLKEIVVDYILNNDETDSSTKVDMYLYIDNPFLIDEKIMADLESLNDLYDNLHIIITKNSSIGKSSSPHILNHISPVPEPKAQRKLIITTEILLNPDEDVSKVIEEFKEDVEYKIYAEYEDTPKITNITEVTTNNQNKEIL